MMKFEFNKGNGVDIDTWMESNFKLEQDLLELARGNVKEQEVLTYLTALCGSLEVIENGKLGEMLFLKYDEPNTMPADARVDFVYRPTYLAATIMMTAYCRYDAVRTDKVFVDTLRKVLNATLGRGFAGAGYESTEGLLDTLYIFAEGSAVHFIEVYPEINEHFTKQLNEAITYLQTQICAGKVINAWAGKDTYSKRGKEIMEMLQNRNNTESEYVWYACYGSNLSRERFMIYINRCEDQTPPVEDRPYLFNHSIYFAKHSTTWEGAKAFLDDTEPGLAYGRIYKVTREQYEGIKLQEGSDYRKPLFLGMIDEISVYSFTDFQKNEKKMPSDDYYNVILKGLKECYTGILDECEMVNYLNKAVMSASEFSVAKEIKKNMHYLSSFEVANRTGELLEDVTNAVRNLVQQHVIRQDRRSINAGHQIDDPNAYFYTEDSKTGRKLIKAMLDAIEAADVSAIDEDAIDVSPETEGARRNVIATRIERSPRNRAMAIAFHGYNCQVCGFDFEQTYGTLGKGYIEVHHVNPLALQEGEQVINPRTDLVCLCANCHRMIHRNRQQVLTVEELTQLLQKSMIKERMRI